MQRALVLYQAHELTRFRERLVGIDPKCDVLQTELQTAKFTVLVRDAFFFIYFVPVLIFFRSPHAMRMVLRLLCSPCTSTRLSMRDTTSRCREWFTR